MGFVIAIDGPAASGKGTLAVRLGMALGYPVLDTGLLYRAVGAAMLAQGRDLDDEAAAAQAARAVDPARLEDPALRTAAAAEAASRVAAHSAVRAALVEAQRAFARREPGAILDGRDIGTVIAPEAPAKIFVTASAAERARRRHAQLAVGDPAIRYETVLADIEERDARDAGRAASPMRPAADAVLLDTTDLDMDVAFDAAHRIVEAARGRWEQSR